MSIEVRERVRPGEHFIGDASNEIVRILGRSKEIDPSLKPEGRYLELKGQVKDHFRHPRNPKIDTCITFVEKDFSEGEISRKAAITASIKYANSDRRFVKTVIKNMADGTAILEIEDTLTFPSFYGEAPKKTIQTARLRRQDNTWKIEEVSDTVKEGQEENRLTDLIPTDAIARTVLEHALELAQAGRSFFRSNNCRSSIKRNKSKRRDCRASRIITTLTLL